MDQGLRRSITLPVGGRARPHSRSVTAVPAPSHWTSENWRAVASCRDSDPNLFYPLGRGLAALEQAAVAKLVCRACPSREPCLSFALATHQELGVWGGTSPEERRQLLRQRRSSAAS